MLDFSYFDNAEIDLADLAHMEQSSNKERFAYFFCFCFMHGKLSVEKKNTGKILDNLLDSEDDNIRYILSKKLCRSHNIPSYAARKLASDKVIIARKVILYSPKLLNSDFIDLIKTSDDPEILETIARRKGISTDVTKLLVEKKNLRVVYRLLKNKTARIGLESFQQIIGKYQHNKEVMNLIHLRSELSPESVNELLQNVDVHLRKILKDSYGFDTLSRNKFSRTSILSLSERSLFKSAESLEIKKRLDLLYLKNQLSPILILRQLCKGDLFSFVYSLSKFTDVPFLSIRQILLVEFDEKKFKEIYAQVGFPEDYQAAVKCLLEIIASSLSQGGLRYSNFSKIISPKFEEISSEQNIKEAKFLSRLIKN